MTEEVMMSSGVVTASMAVTGVDEKVSATVVRPLNSVCTSFLPLTTSSEA